MGIIDQKKLDETIGRAQASTRKRAWINPEQFPEYRRYIKAEQELDRAVAELNEAKRVWANILNYGVSESELAHQYGTSKD